MSWKNQGSIIVVIVIILTLASLAIAFSFVAEGTTGGSVAEWEMMSSKGVLFNITFKEQDLAIDVDAKNTNDERVKSHLSVTVDGMRQYENDINLSAKDGWKTTIPISSGMNAIDSHHEIAVSTVGNYIEFNFTKEVDPSNSEEVPTPYIEDVEITNGTIDGEPSAVAKVTLVNPSIHPYSLKLMVHTQETDGSFYGASVRPGTNRTITVELLDERGSQIAGEARLYAGNLSEGDGAMDQVGFVGRAGEDTSAWNETYEPVKGPWRSDGYEYRNESLADEPSMAERLSRGYDVLGIPAVYVGIGLGVFLVVFRRRR